MVVNKFQSGKVETASRRDASLAFGCLQFVGQARRTKLIVEELRRKTQKTESWRAARAFSVPPSRKASIFARLRRDETARQACDEPES